MVPLEQTWRRPGSKCRGLPEAGTVECVWRVQIGAEEQGRGPGFLRVASRKSLQGLSRGGLIPFHFRRTCLAAVLGIESGEVRGPGRAASL